MERWSLRFEGTEIKKLQEEMIAAWSDIYDALKEWEEEKEYLTDIWRGTAADTFLASLKGVWQEIGNCSKKTESLLSGLINVEENFAQCEKEIENLTQEGFLWRIRQSFK